MSLLAADARSAGKTIAHFDESTEAATNALTVQAKQGEHILAAFGGYSLEIQIEYRASLATSKAENDLTNAALHSIIYESTMSTVTRAALATSAGLSDLIIMDEVTGERQNTNDLRKRTVTLPIQAKLA